MDCEVPTGRLLDALRTAARLLRARGADDKDHPTAVRLTAAMAGPAVDFDVESRRGPTRLRVRLGAACAEAGTVGIDPAILERLLQPLPATGRIELRTDGARERYLRLRLRQTDSAGAYTGQLPATESAPAAGQTATEPPRFAHIDSGKLRHALRLTVGHGQEVKPPGYLLDGVHAAVEDCRLRLVATDGTGLATTRLEAGALARPAVGENPVRPQPEMWLPTPAGEALLYLLRDTGDCTSVEIELRGDSGWSITAGGSKLDIDPPAADDRRKAPPWRKLLRRAPRHAKPASVGREALFYALLRARAAAGGKNPALDLRLGDGTLEVTGADGAGTAARERAACLYGGPEQSVTLESGHLIAFARDAAPAAHLTLHATGNPAEVIRVDADDGCGSQLYQMPRRPPLPGAPPPHGGNGIVAAGGTV